MPDRSRPFSYSITFVPEYSDKMIDNLNMKVSFKAAYDSENVFEYLPRVDPEIFTYQLARAQ